MAERGKFWTATETRLLIDSWSQDSIQKQLHGAKRNDNVFTQIVDTLAKCGYQRTSQQCRAKIKALKKKYKEIADRLRKSGEGRESDVDEVPADFPFFDDIDAVMGRRASVSPVHLLDSVSGDTQPLTGLQEDEDEVDMSDRSFSRPSTSRSTSRPDTPAPLTDTIELDTLPSTPLTSVPETPASEMPDNLGSSSSMTATDIPHPSTRPDTITSSTSTGKGAYEPKTKRRRKMTKLEKAKQSADNLVTKVLADQAKRRKVLADQAKRRAESAEIEKKRLELAECEAERDRQFMQQMIALMIQSVRAQSYPPPAPFPMGYQPGPGYPPSGRAWTRVLTKQSA